MLKVVCRLRPTTVVLPPNKKAPEVRLNIFTSTLANETPQTLVVSSKNAISSRIITDYLKNDQELMRHRQSVFENSDVFSFDQAFGEKVSQQTFYDLLCSSKVNDSINGTSSSFLIFGGTQSGKKHTLHGEDKGIAVLAVEAVLNLIDAQKQSKAKFRLNCSIYSANSTDLVDLIGNTRSQTVKTHQVRYLTDFKNYLRQALFQYKNYLKEQDGKQTQIFISLTLQKDKATLSQINFVLYTEFQKLTKEAYEQQTKLRVFLEQMNDLANNTEIPQSQLVIDNKILETLYVALRQAKFQNISLIFQVSQVQAQFMEAYRTLQFTDELRQAMKNPALTNRTININEQKSRVSFGPESRVGKESLSRLEKVPFENTQASQVQKVGSEHTIQQSKLYKENTLPAQSRVAQSRVMEENYARQFQELKDLLREKESIEDQRLNKFERELRGIYEENIRLINKVAQGEEQLRQRDQLITNLERHIEENRKQIELDQQMYLTAKQKENLYEQNQEELRDTVAQLNSQLRYASEEMQTLRQRIRLMEQDVEGYKENELATIKHYEKREDEFMQLMRQEQQRNRQLYDELEYFSRELKDKEGQITQLEDNIRTLNKVIEEQSKRLEEEKLRAKEIGDAAQAKGKKTEEVIKDLGNLENRYAKIRSRLETENAALKDEKEKYLQKYKEKLRKYKTALKQEEQVSTQLKMDMLKLRSENDQLFSLSKQMETQLGKMHTEVPAIERQNTNIYNELDRQKQLNHQLNEQLQSADFEIRELQSQLQNAVAHLERSNQEYEKVLTENQGLQRSLEERKGEIQQHEYLMDKMVEMSDKQMDELESKFNKVTAQINSLQHEKRSLLAQNTSLKQALEQVEGNEGVLEKRIVKLRKDNKELTRQLQELNSNMREMIIETHQDIKNSSMHQSRFSNAKMLSQNASYRSIRTNNLMLSGQKDEEDYDYDAL